jgi:predicted Zn-dependent peptidase
MVRDPLLPEGELARITNGKVREIDLARSEPYWIAHEQLVGALYGEHPYGRAFPTAPMLRGYTIDQVRSFHAGNFNASRAHLYVVGRFDALVVERAAREAFAAWATGRPATKNAPTPATRYRFIRRDRPSAMLSTIMLGLPIADPSSRDFAALEVTDALLGGSLSSRITSNLRLLNGYAYTPSSGITRYRRSAHWVQQAEVTSKVTGAAVAEILSEIRRLRRETPSMAEVDGVKNNMIGQFVMRNASRTGIVNLLAESDLQELGDDYLSGYVRRVMGVSPAEVRRIAATYFVPERMTLVVVGDESVIAEQLKPYARAAP